MKIISIETFTNEYIGLVRVRSDEGDEGWGQTSTYNSDISAQIVHRQVAPHILGWSGLDIDDLNREVLEREHKFPGTYLYRALCGLDTALWDIRAKRDNMSVCQLLGGSSKSIPVYASSMQREISPEAEAERLLGLKEAHGYFAFKFRIGRECGHDIDQWPGRTEAIVKEVRKVLGDDVTLLVDANSAYSPAKAIEVGHMLQDYGVSHFVIDDMIDTAGTTVNAAEAAMEQGAKSVTAIATHGVLSGPALERLRESSIRKIIITDTIETKEKKVLDNMDIVTVADVFGSAINRIHNDESVSALFKF